jgi:hypothetical protein
MAEARRLEGIYCFERFEPHHAPSKAGLARKAMEEVPESIAC